jgi:hypothetical protein
MLVVDQGAVVYLTFTKFGDTLRYRLTREGYLHPSGQKVRHDVPKDQ